LGVPLRQVAHFVCDDGEAHTRFAGPGRFHSRIQRQDIGLEGDVVE
jgi:hypothetical protein